MGLDVEGGVRLSYQMDTAKLTQDQKTRLPEIRKQLINILTNRVSQSLGVVEGNVQQKGNDQFVVELPGSTDVQKARQTLNTTASIRFYYASNIITDLAPYRRYEIVKEDTGENNPVVYFRSRSNPDKIIKPGDAEYLEIINGWQLILQGSELKSAEPVQHGGSGEYVPSMNFTPEGARKMEAWTRRVNNRHEFLAAVLDNRVLSIASLKDGSEGILSNHCIITGNFTVDYVKNFTTLLNGGALPVDLKEISSQTVDPTIGKNALEKMVLAGAVAFGVICLFLLSYYLFPGVVAVFALALYVLFSLTILKCVGATFSLAAIAALILSIGIAVDANILVFERVKEELRAGKQLLASVELGFKRALPAIIDSNVCTILTSIVLVQLGSGQVKGFASTLIIGLLISLFTTITVTRSLLIFMMGTGVGNHPKWFGLGRQWFGEKLEKDAHAKPLQIVNNAKKFFWISIIAIIPGIIFLGMGGLKANVEFQGGIEAVYEITGADSKTSVSILSELEKNGIEGANVKILSSGDGKKMAYVTVPENSKKKVGSLVSNKQLREKVAKYSGFDIKDERSFTEIGPTVQQESLQNAILGITLGSLFIIIYLAFRFGFGLGGFKNGLRFGISAIVALVHDVLFLLGVAAILGYFLHWEIGMLFITAILTVVGFSVHDAVVIFDRIRENLRRPGRGEDFGELCNRSITQSFARSINTSLTVVMTLFVLTFVGATTPDLKFFCIAMLVGIISGTYSSIYNASPIVYLWDMAVGRKHGEKATLIFEAGREQERMRAASISHNVVNEEVNQYGQVRRRDTTVDRSKHRMDD
jgi:SecD/SecF fusion protein